MNTTDQLIYPKKSNNIIGLIMFGGIAIVAGYFLFMQTIDGTFSTIVLSILGILGFFGAYGSLKQLIKNEPSLIINNKGFQMGINSKRSFGLIAWNDVLDFELSKEKSSEIILVRLKDNDKYINRIENEFIQKMHLKMMERMGTPVFISTQGMDKTTAAIHALLIKKWQENKHE